MTTEQDKRIYCTMKFVIWRAFVSLMQRIYEQQDGTRVRV